MDSRTEIYMVAYTGKHVLHQSLANNLVSTFSLSSLLLLLGKEDDGLLLETEL